MGMGHPSHVVARARELAEAGWKAGKIAQIINRELGLRVHENTVRRWIDPDFAERQRNREAQGGPYTRRWAWRRRLERMRKLREEAELSHAAIAKLFNLDFGTQLNEEKVRLILADRYTQPTVKRLLNGEAS